MSDKYIIYDRFKGLPIVLDCKNKELVILENKNIRNIENIDEMDIVYFKLFAEKKDSRTCDKEDSNNFYISLNITNKGGLNELIYRFKYEGKNNFFLVNTNDTSNYLAFLSSCFLIK